MGKIHLRRTMSELRKEKHLSVRSKNPSSSASDTRECALMLRTREASTKRNHQEVINLKSLNFPLNPSPNVSGLLVFFGSGLFHMENNIDM